MASDITGLIIFFIVCALFIGIIAYSFISNRIAKNRRRELIRAFRQSPVIRNDAPILVQGRAESPDLLLPTTGEHVAFYGLFVLSRDLAVSGTVNNLSARIASVSMTKNNIAIKKGFRFFETSGDFSVISRGTPYTVSVTSLLAQFAWGAAMVASFAGSQVKGAGIPGTLFEDAVNFTVADKALGMLCGFSAPISTERSRMRRGRESTEYVTTSIVTATSRIDARLHVFIAGQNIPQGVQDLLAKRGIVPEDRDEIIVAETFIPLTREVFVFGTFDGDKSIVFRDGTVRLFVSYTDPEEVEEA